MTKNEVALMTANELLKFFITNSGALCTLLVKQNKLLANGDTSLAQESLHKQKELSELIVLVEQRIATSPDLMHEADPKLRAQAKANFLKIQELTMDSMAHAKVGLKVSEGIRELLQNRLVEERMQALGYNKDGKMSSAESLERHMPSVTITSRT
jgi:hypothetical protein